MELLEWNDSFATGILEIDEQHKKLFDIINNLTRDLNYQDFEFEAADYALSDMTDYLDLHFKTEETYMQEFGYQGYDSHRSQHAAFVEKNLAFHRELREERNIALASNILDFLKTWLTSHILASDMKYVPLFKENGL